MVRLVQRRMAHSLEIRFHCSLKGKKFYKVRLADGKEVFLGTLGECRRFIKVHKEKVNKHLARNRVVRAEEEVDVLGNKF